MKKLLLLLILGISFRVHSQNVTACNNAQNICSNPSFQFEGVTGSGLTPGLNISNPTTNPQVGNGANPTAPANSGCLLTNCPGPQWLLLTVSVAGNLGFTFGDPASSNPQVGFYDWAMWPFTPSTCTNIFNNTLPPISCNWNASSTGGTGMGPVPTGGNVGNYQPAIPVTAGQQFLILISNFSSVNTLVSFTSTGTASLTCGFNTAICAGQSTTVSPVGFISLTNPSFTLYPSGINSANGTFTVTPLVSTTYTIAGSGTNAQNQQVLQTSTTVVTVNTQPSAAPTATQSTCTNTVNCFNLHLAFTPATPQPTYTINWGTGVPNGITTPTQSSLCNTGPGAYTATITAAGGCSTTASFTINQQPAAAVFTLNPLGSTFSITCTNSTLPVYATNPSNTYTWTHPTNGQVIDTEILLTNLNQGTWTITGTNPTSGCIATYTFLASQNFSAPSAVISPTFQSINCVVNSIQTVSATANPTINVTHVFSSPSGNTLSAASYTAIYTPGGPGVYTHSVINLVNGCSTTRNFTVATTDNYPTISVSSPDNFTVGCSTESVAVINLTAATTPSAGGALSYTLLAPGFTGSYGYNAQLAYNVTAPGQYTAVVKALGNGCETKVSFSVIQDIQGPDIGADVPVPVLSCDTRTSVMTAISANPNASFAWTFPSIDGAPAGSIINPTLSIHTTTNTNSSAVAIYTLTIRDERNKCISTLTVNIRQNTFPPRPIISGGVTMSITCAQPSVTLNNSSLHHQNYPVFFPSQLDVIATKWEGPTPQLVGQLTSNYFAFTPGIYTLTVKDLNNGCTSQTITNLADNRVYPIVNKPTAPPPYVMDCGAVSATIAPKLTPPTNGFAYQWIILDNSQIGIVTTNSVLSVTEPGTYRILVTNTLNGCPTLGEVSIVAGELTGAFVPDQISGYAPMNVTFQNTSLSSLNNSSITSVWNYGNGTTASYTNVTSGSALYTQPGTYTVTLFATKGVCQDTAIRIIHVDIPSKLEIPNVFTPNGDGVNDLFFLKAANLTEISILIYDRWGHNVYELVSNTGNIAWDGKNPVGKEVAAGTYFYIIKATGKDSQTYEYKGHVDLVK